MYLKIFYQKFISVLGRGRGTYLPGETSDLYFIRSIKKTGIWRTQTDAISYEKLILLFYSKIQNMFEAPGTRCKMHSRLMEMKLKIVFANRICITKDVITTHKKNIFDIA